MKEITIPIGKPILLEEFRKIEHLINDDEIYGRFGTETGVYADYYESYIPEHLEGKVTHVWLYYEK